jgi:DNA repair exonuclease SbcCD ATPase subunit
MNSIAQKHHIAKMNRITETDRMVEQLEIDSRMPVIKCPLGCGQNHGLNEFNWECRACIMQAGRTVLLTDLDNSMPMRTQIWKRKLNEEKGNEHKATMLIVCRQEFKASEAKLQDSEVKLKASEAKLDSEVKLKASEAKLQDSEVKLKVSETKLDSEVKLKASEAKLQDSEVKLKVSETKLQDSEAKLKASEAKLKAVEAMLKDAEAKLQTHESTLKAEAETLRQILNKPFFMNV